MEVVMDAQGLWESVEPVDGSAVDEKKNKTARAFFFQAIPEDVLLQVAKKKTAKEIWESLKTRYVGAARVQKARLHTLTSEFEKMKMKDGESIDEFAGRLSGLASKYNKVGSTLEDEKLVRKLLDGVPDMYLQLVASMEQYSDVETMPFEEAVGRLKAYEDRLKLRQGGAGGESGLLLTKSDFHTNQKSPGKTHSTCGRGRGWNGDRGGRNGGRGRGSSRGRGGRWGGGSHQETQNTYRKPKDKKHIKCFKCDQTGHYASECETGKKQGEEIHLTQGGEEESLLLTIGGEEVPTVMLLTEEKVFPHQYDAADKQNRDTWYLDNGASNHMTGIKEMFAELDENVTGFVRFGDGSRVQIRGKGIVLFDCKNGDQFMVRGVYYIPALNSNIISLGQMTEEGYEVLMRREFLRMYDEQGKLIMKVQRSSNRLYKIILRVSKPVCLVAKLDDEGWMWHARLGHVNFQTLESMTRKELVQGVPVISHLKHFCEGCMVAKQTRQPFPHEASWRASRPLELVHADLCGPITPQTKGGNRYFFLIVDDFCRYMWVYLLKSKDEALSKFKNFTTEVKKHKSWKIGTIRTDRGGEFTSKAFDQFCDDEGIKHQLTAPYTPQQNSVVERRNRTVMEVTRSLLKTMALPEFLWGEAVRQTVYLLNRVPTKGFENKFPYEGWKGMKPKLQHVKIFGCVGYVKKTGKHLGKLCDRSLPMVYLGAEYGINFCRMYNPNEDRVCVVRYGDVKFDEKKQWVWKETIIREPTPHPNWANVPVQEIGPSQQAQTNTSGGDGSQNILTPTNSHIFPSLFDSAGTQQERGNSTNSVSISSQNSSSSGSISNSTYDDTPPQGLRTLNDVYERTEPIKADELLLVNNEPTTYTEATNYNDWREAMKSEVRSIEKNQTWLLVDLPVGHKAIGLKWVYKLKKDPSGQVTKCKARLVAKGYVQRKGIDFDEVFAPVERLETIRFLLALAAKEGWFVHHLDVKSAFLNGELAEEVYVTQPEGFVVKGEEQKVYKLKKALYGLRQAPRAWNARLD
ncbi:putative RNA-directed DNA polymerase [Helianthus debilis subsp. tardiflorus]